VNSEPTDSEMVRVTPPSTDSWFKVTKSATPRNIHFTARRAAARPAEDAKAHADGRALHIERFG
jgi:hypothetical protein